MLSVKATNIRSCKLQTSINPVRRSQDMLSIYLGPSCLHFAMNATRREQSSEILTASRDMIFELKTANIIEEIRRFTWIFSRQYV